MHTYLERTVSRQLGQPTHEARAETKLALALPCEEEEDRRSTGNNFFVDLWKGTEESIRFRLALIIVYNGAIFIEKFSGMEKKH